MPACKDADESYLRQTVSPTCTIERLDDRALLALQGPAAEAALARLAPDVRSMRFMDVRAMEVMDVACTVSRSGYTGEDGFEISLPASHAEAVARALLANGDVAMIGLGARDSLRLEAGLCLYGSDLDATTTPVEAGLEWSIQKVRRAGEAARAIFRAPRKFCANSRTVHRGGGWGCAPRAGRRSATGRGCLRTRARRMRSAW